MRAKCQPTLPISRDSTSGDTHDYTILAEQAFGMVVINHVVFLVCVYEHQVERGAEGRREGFKACRSHSGEDSDFVNEACSGEVLGCDFDGLEVFF